MASGGYAPTTLQSWQATAPVTTSMPITTPFTTSMPVTTPVTTSMPITTPVTTSMPITTPVTTSMPVTAPVTSMPVTMMTTTVPITSRAGMGMAPVPLEMSERRGASGLSGINSTATVAPSGPLTNTATAGAVDLKFGLSLDKRAALQEMIHTVPESLRARGVSEREWHTVCDYLLKFQEENYFYKNCGGNAPLCEGCYWCCPLGPVQCVLCLFNPFTWVFCILPEQRAGERASTAINDVLSKYSVQCTIKDTTIKFSAM